jgi:choline/glycine/proline betaine transport protein
MKQKIFNRWGFYFNPVVFISSATVIASFVLIGSVDPEGTATFFSKLQNVIASSLGWFYTFSVTVFLCCIIYLIFSPVSKQKLGKQDSTPEFSNLSWYSMLFSAGMGIGILFYGIAEPMMHFATPPTGSGVDALSPEAMAVSMKFTYYHWGLHAWAIYMIMGLLLGYFHHRQGLPLAPRSILYPILGEKIYGLWGDCIDVFAIFGTLFGIATSLGLGVLQINAGLDFLEYLPQSRTNQYLLIGIITFFATLSVVSGLGNGIKILSIANIFLAAILMLFVFISGPTAFLLNSFLQNTGTYLQELVSLSFYTVPYQDQGWRSGWSLFYWSWWIAWSPFVGIFLARISKGRTIREFLTGILIVPSLITFLWLSIFGNSAYWLFKNNQGENILKAISDSETVPYAFFMFLEQLPFANFSSFIAVLVIASFFITSSDSGSFVIDIVSAAGNPDPPVSQRVFWAIIEGAVAAVLLAFGGLQGLQMASITCALPLCILLFVALIGFLRTIKENNWPHS